MKLKSVIVKNYRNISDCVIELHSESNYIIGENNLGKSNFLYLLDNVCSGKSFEETDFFNAENPIEIILEINLISNEYGFFGDVFSPENASVLKIRYTQNIDDAYPTIVSCDTGEAIQARQLKKLHFIRYDTNSTPSKELRIDTQKGAGKLINNIIEKYINDEENGESFVNSMEIEKLANHINNHLEKIKSFKEYSIKATISEKSNEILSKLFYLSDSEREIYTTGSGVQYIAMGTINILYQIMNIYKSKTVVFNDHIYVDDSDKKILPLVLAVDEPEVHLHPFLQRSLIRYYKRILSNKDSDFVELLKMCFDIDGLDGQLIIVTHSTDALVDNYRNIIRFFQNEEKTDIVCGSSLKLRNTNEKHLLMHFPELKEAFYSKCAILIEGETEYGCINSFAEALDVSLDDFGICVINAGGEKSIKPIKSLLSAFGIPSVSIYDGDVKIGRTPDVDEFFTTELCFEIEIVKKLYDSGQASLIKQIVQEYDSNGMNEILDLDYVKKPLEKMGIDTNSYVPKNLASIDDTDCEEFCNMYSAWFIKKKGVLMGRLIGEKISAELIPECYKNAIMKTKEISTHA